MCSTLSLLAFIEATDAEDLRGFFNTPGNLFCSCVAMICFVGVFLFPLWGHHKVHQAYKLKTLESFATKEKLGIFYKDIKTNSWSSVMYNFYFMSRRFMTVMILIWMEDLPFFQMQFLLIFSLINFIYLVTTKPIE